MKQYLTILELNRVLKFVNGLNALGREHGVGLSPVESEAGSINGLGIRLVVDGTEIPFELDADEKDDDLFLVVSL